MLLTFAPAIAISVKGALMMVEKRTFTIRAGQVLAAQQQRKHQQFDPSVPAQGNGLVGTQRGRTGCDRNATEHALR